MKKIIVITSILVVIIFISLLMIINPTTPSVILLLTSLTIIYLLLVLLIYQLVIYLNKRKKSLLLFLERVEKNFNNNCFNADKTFNFNRYVKYDNQVIPLGKLIIDEKRKKILIYETFFSKDEHLICLPDIRIFKYNDLISCQINLNGELMSLNELDKLHRLLPKKKLLFDEVHLILKIENHFFKCISLRLYSINDYELFCDIYSQLSKIVKENKKIA